jgi:hypothetical protein
MCRARDPTAKTGDGDAAVRARAAVNAHLEALRGAGDGAMALGEDVALTIMETGEVTRGRTSVAALLAYLHCAAFAAPPAVSTLVVGTDRAMIEAEFAGRHLAEFAGILPTGRLVRLPYVVAYDLDADTNMIHAMRLYFSMDMLVRQLRET